MKLNKQDFLITQFDRDHFRISIRKPFLFIFTRWVELTHVDADGEDEQPVEYKTFDDAANFINDIVE